eukprot:TRINITY_DN266_c0_g1_i14.p1 TRINITY_DN266_c0_g1~~TRINITY_DN266_c0_g1_i14.p1  ORF type:complete len:318 (-),score=-100.11 TRINITY_DN266_c0_g1_i14:307-1260(-)
MCIRDRYQRRVHGMTNIDYLLIGVIVMLVLITLIALLILVERKFLALSQRRIGPTILGRRGFLQIAADVIKPLFKEIFEQKFQAVSLISFMIFVLLASQLIYMSLFSYGISGVLYDSQDWVVMLQLVLSAFSTIAVLLIGYLSGTKYGIIGSIRIVLSEVSIDVVISILNTLLLYSTGGYDYETILVAQYDVGGLALLGIVYSVLYIIQMFISAQRAPLDLIENEGELVAGYNTEFSGPDVLVIYFAEYLHILNGALQFVYLVLGYSIFLPSGAIMLSCDLLDNVSVIALDNYFCNNESPSIILLRSIIGCGRRALI